MATEEPELRGNRWNGVEQQGNASCIVARKGGAVPTYTDWKVARRSSSKAIATRTACAFSRPVCQLAVLCMAASSARASRSTSSWCRDMPSDGSALGRPALAWNRSPVKPTARARQLSSSHVKKPAWAVCVQWNPMAWGVACRLPAHVP